MKGFNKGLKMISLVQKGALAALNPYYFSFLLIMRSVSSALYRAVMLAVCLKRTIRKRKIFINLTTNGLPTAILFLAISNRVPFLGLYFEGVDLESEAIVRAFIIYMTVNRIVRTFLQIKKQMKKR
mmetsp:Transcript_11578/g.8456  ORF Transcript_11578/g.8456 Transcript_11578/m.8456 type:complete len:126 (-) Transcript_11578:75-452(-)